MAQSRKSMRERWFSLVTRSLNWHAFRANKAWPERLEPNNGARPKVAVVCVSFNTKDVLSMALFGLFRVADAIDVERVVIVDNASKDGSVELLEEMQRLGAIDLIRNRFQRFHGPGVNQGVRHLRRLVESGEASFDQILVLDSDALLLREDSLRAPSMAMQESSAAALGEYHNGTQLVSGGYAHISTLWIDPHQVVGPHLPPFIDSGQPGVAMQKAMRRQDIPIVDFPLRSAHYVLHIENVTLDFLAETGNRLSSHGVWANENLTGKRKFHGEPSGPRLLASFLEAFEREVTSTDPVARARMLTEGGRVTIEVGFGEPSSGNQ